MQDPFITFLPLQECESLLSCLVTLCSGQTSVSQLGRSCSDASAFSLPVYFDGIYAIAKVKGVIFTYIFWVI